MPLVQAWSGVSAQRQLPLSLSLALRDAWPPPSITWWPQQRPPACSGEPGLGHPTCTGLSPHPQASPDKARSSLRPALSMMRAATAVNSTWKMPTTTEARLLS